MPSMDALSESDIDSERGVADEPAVIFEVPPHVTDDDVLHALGDERVGEIDRLLQLRGIDALGAYLTFHQLAGQYGIYIPFEGVLLMAARSFWALDLPPQRKLELAFHAILRHELFHFEADCMVANWEMITGVEVYWSSRRHRNGNGYIEAEEALANAYMLRGFKHPTRLLSNAPGAYAALKKFCEKKQPAGYKDGPKYAKNRTEFLRECSRLSDMYHTTSSAAWHVPYELDKLIVYPDPVRIDWTRVPIIIEDRYGLFAELGITPSYFSIVNDIEETDNFLRAFRKLDRSIQKRWSDSKSALSRSTALKSLDFKQWKKDGPDYYSVRVGGNYRVHLRYDRDDSRWFAEAIGNHKTMGHK
ncbi:Uncharacterised protein [Mycolicibacterium vanbaalenii]|uniref:Uncharacterized protein n=2 Tax=Mycolicibacterium vanbaalenii TaxID=110539 RepID=A0A5S9RBG7_MYCVN|nr:Uncharacterised protein [Mycolicibacterium vanbaalenii]